MRGLPDRLKAWAARTKRGTVVLWLAVRDRETPPLAKGVAAATVAYALSPIDLIPDFVPVLGLVDDLVLVPLGIALALRLIPEGATARLRARAAETPFPANSLAGAAIVLAFWLAALYAIADHMNFSPL